MKQRGTDLYLRRDCIYEYAMGRGRVTMEEICEENHYGQRYREITRAQDAIGWQRFTEGVICKEIGLIQRMHTGLQASRLSAKKWGVGLVTKLLEVTHGQWLYCNIQVHVKISGTLVTLRKVELQLEIERQQELGTAGLLDEDCHHLAEYNLGDLEDSSGAKETYWLLAIRAAQEGSRLLAITMNGVRAKQGGAEIEEGNHRDGH